MGKYLCTNASTMPMADLWKLWDQYFPSRPPNHHRGFVEGKLAFAIQEKVYGGVEPTDRKQLINIGESQSKIKTRQKTELQIVAGTVFVREFAGREHRVVALPDGGFEHEGKRYKSLSAVARVIAGCAWSGPVFFGLAKTKRTAS